MCSRCGTQTSEESNEKAIRPQISSAPKNRNGGFNSRVEDQEFSLVFLGIVYATTYLDLLLFDSWYRRSNLARSASEKSILRRIKF